MVLTLEIVDLAQGGEGVARADGRAVFVPFTAPGDRVVADVPAGDGTAHARLATVLTPGPARVAAPCPHFGAGPGAGCGGCEWLHLGYQAQLEAKGRALAETLRRIARIDPRAHDLRPLLASPSPLRYRARAKFHLDRASGRLVFFRRRSHEPVVVTSCHLLEPELDRLREAVGPALARARVEAREVTLEWSRHAARGAVLLQLPSIGASARSRVEAFLREVPELSGAVLASADAPVAVVGEPVLRLERHPGAPERGLQRSRPDVFQQANRGANAILVERAVAMLQADGEDVLELFCGAGNFTGPLSARARAVYAVELQGPSLELARRDLEGRNVRFHAGDALAVSRGLVRDAASGGRRFAAALLDPPREGARGVGAVLRDLGIPRVAYVSCDPATLARDVKGCMEAGYRLEAIQPVDMFPQTHHVEAIAVLVLEETS